MTAAWDAAVIGAGPAGSSVAAYLAKAGRRVLLLEREKLPRTHVGESLLPGVLPYLDALGVRDLVERDGFVRKEGQTFVWGRDRTPWELDFRELDVHPYAFFVERARFDEILARNAALSGAELREGATVREIVFEDGRATGVVVRDAEGNVRTESARFVVDASGQSALVARGAGLRRMIRGLKNLAVWSYWEGAERLPGRGESHILTVSIPTGWIWCIPLRDRMSVGVVTSSDGKLGSREETAQWYEAQLRSAEPVWKLLSGARRVEAVSSARDWSYRCRRTSGPGILLAGDAACFVDPILSTGVHLAMTSGRWAAATIHSALREPAAEPVFRRFYDEQYRTTFRELLAQVRSFYRFEGRRDSVYWQSRTILRTKDALPPRLAFLFVTAGLLRNATEPDPNRVGQALHRALGERAPSPVGAEDLDRMLTPPRALRLGAEGKARLVSLRARDLDLEIVPYEPRSVHDRPRGTYAALEVQGSDGHPVALALFEEARAEDTRAATGQGSARWRVVVIPYPVRPHGPGTLERLQRDLERLVRVADDRTKPLRAHRLVAGLRRASKAGLGSGFTLARSASFRGPTLDEPPVTLVLATPERSLERIYLRAEARFAPDLVEIPPLRTRFVDLWIEPGRDRAGTAVQNIPSIARVLEDLSMKLWKATLSATTTADALVRAERVLESFEAGGFSRVACGRLGA